MSPIELPNEQLWYPQHDYLLPPKEPEPIPETQKEIEKPVEKKPEKIERKEKEKPVKKIIEAEKPEPEVKKPSRERKISLVNDDYLSGSDYDVVKEEVVKKPKIELDVKRKSVKVRSRWDSDYENESVKEEPEPIKEEDMEISTPEEHIEAPIITEEVAVPVENVKVVPFPGLDPMKLLEAQVTDFPVEEKQIEEAAKSPEHLVSEYEQFEQFIKAVEMEVAEKVKTPENSLVEEDEEKEEDKEEIDEWDEESENEEEFQKMKMALSEKSESEELNSSAKSKKSANKKKSVEKKKKVTKIKKKKPKMIKKVVKK